MISLHTIDAGTFKLDGGAMFGVVPKSLWSKLNPPDADNLCTWSLRCLLLQSGSRKILFDTGMGTKQDLKFFSHYQPSGHVLKESLLKEGVHPDEITDVFLTHLHFDHCGGALELDTNGSPVPSFRNATYWTCSSHLEWALHPNARERASFLKENIVPLIESGVLEIVPEEQNYEWLEGITVMFAYGHTQAMMIPKIPYKDTKVVYCADLLPSAYHLGLPYVMSYDVRPLVTLEEKSKFLKTCVDENAVLYFEHDPVHECMRIQMDERGRFSVNEFLNLNAL